MAESARARGVGAGETGGRDVARAGAVGLVVRVRGASGPRDQAAGARGQLLGVGLERVAVGDGQLAAALRREYAPQDPGVADVGIKRPFRSGGRA